MKVYSGCMINSMPINTSHIKTSLVPGCSRASLIY